MLQLTNPLDILSDSQTSGEPEITLPLSNRTVCSSIGKNETFTVQTKHTPVEDTINYWLFNGIYLDSTSKYDFTSKYSHSDDSECTLTIKNVAVKDAGRYDFVVKTDVSNAKISFHMSVNNCSSDAVSTF